MANFELLIKNILKIFKENLNTQITNINSQNTDYKISLINDNAWDIQYLGRNTLNYNPFAMIAMPESPKVIDSTGPDTSFEVEIHIEVVLSNINAVRGQEPFFRLIRYARALEFVFKNNYDKLQVGNMFTFSTLVPTSFEVESKTYHSSGIGINLKVS